MSDRGMTEAIKKRHLLRFRCTSCANCCRDMHVPVTDADVRRLMEFTGRRASELVGFYTQEHVGHLPGGKGWIKTRPGRVFMGLRQQPDGSCVHLQENRCAVYEARPVTCRVFPFNLYFDEAGRRVEELEINQGTECLYELDGKVSLRNLISTYHWDDRQDEEYFTKVASWNRRRRPGTAGEFLSYLGLE